MCELLLSGPTGCLSILELPLLVLNLLALRADLETFDLQLLTLGGQPIPFLAQTLRLGLDLGLRPDEGLPCRDRAPDRFSRIHPVSRSVLPGHRLDLVALCCVLSLSSK